MLLRKALISLGKPIVLKVPDGFNFSIKPEGKDLISDYEEFIIEDEKDHAETTSWFMNWQLREA
jgi:hypothetical protein